MPIQNEIYKEKDAYYVTVGQVTLFTLHVIKKNNPYLVDSGVLSIDTPTLLCTREDGEYNLTLTVEGEDPISHTFYVMSNLQNSIIRDAYALLCNKKDCGCKKNNNCLSKEGKKCLKTKNIYVKLLSFQTFYIPKYTSPTATIFNEYLVEAVKLYKCDLQSKINAIIKDECIYGGIKDTIETFKLFVFLFWYAMYYMEYTEASTEEEKDFVQAKYKYSLLLDCLCSLCIDVSDLEDILISLTPEEPGEPAPLPIPVDTNIYAIFDSSSMDDADATAAVTAVKEWFAQYQIDHPLYVGKLFILASASESYLYYAGTPYNQFLANQTTTGIWSTLTQAPEGFAMEGLATPDLKAIVLSFIDESHSFYHGTKVADGFDIYDTGDPTVLNDTQPTDIFLNQFVSMIDFNSEYEFFRNVLYPIPKDVTGIGGSLVLQILAALKGDTLTQDVIDSYNSSVDLSLLLTTNPYKNAPIPNSTDTYTNLEDYGFIAVLDKQAPAIDVFTSETFNEELNNLLEM